MAPAWAASMIANFRRMYRDTYGMETKCTDDQIWHFCETINDDADPVEGDKQRLKAMRLEDSYEH